MCDLTSKKVAAHRANLRRYRQLMRTPLEPHERQYLLKRIAEEEAVLQALHSGGAASTRHGMRLSATATGQDVGDTNMSRANNLPFSAEGPELDMEEFLHPAAAFDHPMDVVRDPDLTLYEKRAILSSWASDACAVESTPSIRRTPAGKAVSFDDIIDALRSLDREPASRELGSSATRRHSQRRDSGDGGLHLS